MTSTNPVFGDNTFILITHEGVWLLFFHLSALTDHHVFVMMSWAPYQSFQVLKPAAAAAATFVLLRLPPPVAPQ